MITTINEQVPITDTTGHSTHRFQSWSVARQQESADSQSEEFSENYHREYPYRQACWNTHEKKSLWKLSKLQLFGRHSTSRLSSLWQCLLHTRVKENRNASRVSILSGWLMQNTNGHSSIRVESLGELNTCNLFSAPQDISFSAPQQIRLKQRNFVIITTLAPKQYRSLPRKFKSASTSTCQLFFFSTHITLSHSNIVENLFWGGTA